MAKAKGWEMLFLILAIAGGANWVTVGVFDFNILTWLFNLGGVLSSMTASYFARFVEVVAGGSIVALLWDKF